MPACRLLTHVIPWMALHEIGAGTVARGSLQPIRERNTTTLDDRPHGAKRKDTTPMMRHDDLLPS